MRIEKSERNGNIAHFALFLTCNDENDREEWSCDRISILSLLHRTRPGENVNVNVSIFELNEINLMIIFSRIFPFQNHLVLMEPQNLYPLQGCSMQTRYVDLSSQLENQITRCRDS